MTNNVPRYIEASDIPGLAALVAEMDAGIPVVLTRAGKPIVALTPIAEIAGREPTTIAREAPATYASGVARPPQPATALLRLVGGVATRSVLGIFVRQPQAAVHQREIARRAGVGLRSAQLALARLQSLGLVVAERDGNRLYYRANRNSRFEELSHLLGREFGMVGGLAKALAEFGDRIHWAFVFGSAAEGSDTVDSDVDLFVVGEVTRRELAGPIAAAQRELGRDIDVSLYRPRDFRKRRAEGNHFVTTVLENPRVDVIGGPDAA